MSISVEFYNNVSDNNVINKKISRKTSYSFDNVYDIDTKYPYFKIGINTVSSDNLKWAYNGNNRGGVNYVYISTVRRYYYIDKTEVKQGFLYFYLKEDVLMSFANDILASKQLIGRSEKYFNRYLNDENYKALNYNRLQFKKFPYGFTGSYKYILLVGGGR